jgi:hypothetical protein
MLVAFGMKFGLAYRTDFENRALRRIFGPQPEEDEDREILILRSFMIHFNSQI